MANPSVKKWCMTLNNYTEAEYQLICNLECNHMVIGKEVGDNGTPHLQCYFNFKRSHRMTALKRTISPRGHWEPCIADEASINYCKKDGEFHEVDNRHQGERVDLKEIYALAQTQKWGTIAKEYPGQVMRYHAGIKCLFDWVDEPQGNEWHAELEVHVRWGKAGTGKTRFFYEKFPNLHSMQAHNGFWTRYRGQDVVLLDDFDGSWCKRATFLQMTDKRATIINQKGGQATWNPKIICITSNTDPRLWYSKEPAAVMRRLTSVKHCVEPLNEDPHIAGFQQIARDMDLIWRPME